MHTADRNPGSFPLLSIHYDFEDYPAAMFRREAGGIPNPLASPHCHQELEFVYVKSEKMVCQVGEEQIVLLPTEGLFINTCQPHCYPHRDDCRRKKDSDFFALLFSPDVLGLNPQLEASFALPLLENPNLACLHLKPSIPWQEDVLHSLLDMERCWASPTAPLRLQSLLLQVWETLYLRLVYTGSSEAPALPSLRSMLEYIHQSYAEKILLKDIAKAGFVSENTCIALFNRHLGVSPTSYLNKYRLEKAAQLLVTTKLSVTDVALATGFASSSYFIKLFHQAYQIPPSEYRRQCCRCP